MRVLGLALLVLAYASPAFAQSAYDGPLAAPDAPVVASPSHHSKSKKVHHAAARPAVAKPAVAKPAVADDAFGAPAPGAAAGGTVPPVRKSVADDPLSLGMKWNGNNDSVAQTRSQNLGGDAFGSGAEVGMKLHF